MLVLELFNSLHTIEIRNVRKILLLEKFLCGFFTILWSSFSIFSSLQFNFDNSIFVPIFFTFHLNRIIIINDNYFTICHFLIFLRFIKKMQTMQSKIIFPYKIETKQSNKEHLRISRLYSNMTLFVWIKFLILAIK